MYYSDYEYSNLFGAGRKARRIDAATDQIKAQSSQLVASTDAKMQQVKKDLDATEASMKKVEELKKQLEEANQYTPPTLTPMAQAPVSGQPTDIAGITPPKGISKTLLIGGGIAVVGLVVLVLLIRK